MMGGLILYFIKELKYPSVKRITEALEYKNQLHEFHEIRQHYKKNKLMYEITLRIHFQGLNIIHINDYTVFAVQLMACKLL